MQDIKKNQPIVTTNNKIIFLPEQPYLLSPLEQYLSKILIYLSLIWLLKNTELTQNIH